MVSSGCLGLGVSKGVASLLSRFLKAEIIIGRRAQPLRPVVGLVVPLSCNRICVCAYQMIEYMKVTK